MALVDMAANMLFWAKRKSYGVSDNAIRENVSELLSTSSARIKVLIGNVLTYLTKHWMCQRSS